MPRRKLPNWYTEQHLVEPVVAAVHDTDGWLIDLGCGPGALTGPLAARFSGRVVGVDASEGRLEQARVANPGIDFHVVDLEDGLPPALHGRFAVAVATEVIEHLPRPRSVFRAATDAGASQLVLTTPYHGYWKNLALALTGRFDRHWQVHKDGGHVKFFSVATITSMAEEQGWQVHAIERIGRISPLAMSMLVDLRR